LESPVRDALARQARDLHSPFATYVERVISLAHGFTSPFLPDPQLFPLPIVSTPDELRRHTSAIDVHECVPLTPGVDNAKAKVTLDRELADRINARCEELDVAYSAYLRAVLRPAAGYTTASVRRLHVQDILELDEGMPHSRAS